MATLTVSARADGISQGAAIQKFVFSDAEPNREAGVVQVKPQQAFSTERGYGFEAGAERVFSVALAPGNYEIKATLGDAKRDSDTSIKSEARRVSVLNVRLGAGKFETRSFAVNVREPRLDSGLAVKLKPREVGSKSWDGKLSLEFCGPLAAVRALEVRRASSLPTLFIAGDSTVCDQAEEPWAGWGQMMPVFFGARVAVANYAESGESLRSFRGERRLDKIAEQMKAGDTLLIQFGHNDQKERGEGIGAFGSYKNELKYFVAQARQRGATPVLVTPMHRRRFDEQGRVVETLGDFPQAVRQVAEEEKVALIDLNAMSRKLYEAWGREGSKQAFVHYPAHTFPGQSEALKDDTHFNAYGAYELARCLVQGLRESNLPLKYLLEDGPTFDPAQPDAVASIQIPASTSSPIIKPDGS